MDNNLLLVESQGEKMCFSISFKSSKRWNLSDLQWQGIPYLRSQNCKDCLLWMYKISLGQSKASS